MRKLTDDQYRQIASEINERLDNPGTYQTTVRFCRLDGKVRLKVTDHNHRSPHPMIYSCNDKIIHRIKKWINSRDRNDLFDASKYDTIEYI